VKDGSYVEGNKKAVTVMVKDAKKYETTGGWGEPSKPPVPDASHAVQGSSPVTRRKKPRTTRFRPTFPEIGSSPQNHSLLTRCNRTARRHIK
jgi:hypothetical protein